MAEETAVAIRRVAMEAAILVAPMYQKHGWEWVGKGVPGIEDIADEIEYQLKRLGPNLTANQCGRLTYLYWAETGERTVHLDIGTVEAP